MINPDKEYQESNVLVFVDIETTGLERSKDKILEVGFSVTDLQMNVLGTWSSLVVPEGWRARLAGNEYVWNMHTNSGLIKELDAAQEGARHPGNMEPPVIAWMAYKWLTEDMGLLPGILPSCGNSVHFDREMLRETMITLDTFFNYRNIDISTVKELCRRYNRELYNSIKEQFNKDSTAHRVKEDIESSIRELKIYVDNFLFVPGNALDDYMELDQQQLVIPGMEALK